MQAWSHKRCLRASIILTLVRPGGANVLFWNQEENQRFPPPQSESLHHVQALCSNSAARSEHLLTPCVACGPHQFLFFFNMVPLCFECQVHPLDYNLSDPHQVSDVMIEETATEAQVSTSQNVQLKYYHHKPRL